MPSFAAVAARSVPRATSPSPPRVKTGKDVDGTTTAQLIQAAGTMPGEPSTLPPPAPASPPVLERAPRAAAPSRHAAALLLLEATKNSLRGIPDEHLVLGMGHLLDSLVVRSGSAAGLALARVPSVFDADVPLAMTVPQFVQHIVVSQLCSRECVVVAYILVRRLLQRYPQLVLTLRNVHRLIVVSMMVGSKVIDDRYCRNTFYAMVANVSTAELNCMELEYCFLQDFDVSVTLEQYSGQCQLLLEDLCVRASRLVDRPLATPAPAASLVAPLSHAFAFQQAADSPLSSAFTAHQSAGSGWPSMSHSVAAMAPSFGHPAAAAGGAWCHVSSVAGTRASAALMGSPAGHYSGAAFAAIAPFGRHPHQADFRSHGHGQPTAGVYGYDAAAGYGRGGANYGAEGANVYTLAAQLPPQQYVPLHSRPHYPQQQQSQPHYGAYPAQPSAVQMQMPYNTSNNQLNHIASHGYPNQHMQHYAPAHGFEHGQVAGYSLGDGYFAYTPTAAPAPQSHPRRHHAPGFVGEFFTSGDQGVLEMDGLPRAPSPAPSSLAAAASYTKKTATDSGHGSGHMADSGSSRHMAHSDNMAHMAHVPAPRMVDAPSTRLHRAGEGSAGPTPLSMPVPMLLSAAMWSQQPQDPLGAAAAWFGTLHSPSPAPTTATASYPARLHPQMA